MDSLLTVTLSLLTLMASLSAQTRSRSYYRNYGDSEAGGSVTTLPWGSVTSTEI